MINYDTKLAERLHNDNHCENINGVQVHIKSIPDEPRAGYMDPREFAMVKKAMEALAASGESFGEMSIDELRNGMGFPNLNMNTVEIYTKYIEKRFDENTVGIWVYYPRRPVGKTGRPGFLYLHGGAWIGGTPYVVENPCKLLAERADCVVFNIDYSLAPEKPYPNALNDCMHALKYIYENAGKFGVDKNKLGIGGDSAGGNLAAICAVKDRDDGTGMLKYQALLYPAVTMISSGIPGYKWTIDDYTMCDEQKAVIDSSISIGRPKENGEASDDMCKIYLKHGEDPRNPYISPIFTPSFAGICKTLIAGAEYDGLRIQGELYAKKLLEAGVDTRVIRYKGITHAFLDKLGVLPQAEDVISEIAADILTL